MKKLILVFTALSSMNLVQAQRQVTFSTALEIANPEGHFEDVFNGTPAGINLNLSIPVSRRSLIEIGADYSYQHLSRKSFDVDIHGDACFCEDAEMDLNGNINAFHIQGRFKPFNGKIMPYVDGVVGTKLYAFRSRINFRNGFDDSELWFDDWTDSYGWGTGIQTKVNRNISVDVRYRKMYGTDLSIVDQSTINMSNDGFINYEVVTSPTSNSDVVQAGVTFHF